MTATLPLLLLTLPLLLLFVEVLDKSDNLSSFTFECVRFLTAVALRCSASSCSIELALVSNLCVAEEKSDNRLALAPGDGGKDIGVYITTSGLLERFAATAEFLFRADLEALEDLEDLEGWRVCGANVFLLVAERMGLVGGDGSLYPISSSSWSWS